MKRVVIVGISGAGKSTLCRRLAAQLGVPYHHLDNIYHSPGWVARATDDVQQDFDVIAAQDAWVVDGNYRRLTTAFRERADAIIFLDYSRYLGLYRILKRWAFHKLGICKRADLGNGFDEQMSLDFIKWVWNWPRDSGANWREELKAHAQKTKILTSSHAVDVWLKSL